ncbi:MAG: branched-chain amino acid transaminase [Longimicrobiales bacterium]
MKQFTPTDWVWRDGELIRWEEAGIHVLSHVVHYGSSVFEGLRCYATADGPAVFRLREHLRRLHRSCRVYRMPMRHSVDALADAVRSVIEANGLDECYVRPVALRGFGALGVNPAASPDETYIACWPWGAYLGDGALDGGIDVCVSSWRRAAPDTFPMLAKAGGHYLAAQLMKMEAEASGFAEAIALGIDGRVSEGSGENVFLVIDGALITPAVDGSQLPGITRDAVITIATDIGIPVREELVPRERLYMADELFLTGTAAEITPVRSVDRITVGDGSVGPMTRMLQQRLLGIARGTAPDPYGWRFPIARQLDEVAR